MNNEKEIGWAGKNYDMISRTQSTSDAPQASDSDDD